MGKFEKGLIALVLLLVGGIGLMCFPTGKRDESSSEVLDTSEYQKALKVTHPKNRELHVELTAKTADKKLKVRVLPPSLSSCCKKKTTRISTSSLAARREPLSV